MDSTQAPPGDDAAVATPSTATDAQRWQRKKILAFGAMLLVSLLADQLTKVWARASLAGKLAPTVVIDGWFDLRYSENPGSAFGLLRDVPFARWILLGVGIGAMVVVWSLLKKTKPEQARVPYELGLLAGGALGNIIDRVLRSKVTDFVVWKYHNHEWPTFNIADAALVVGVIALLFDMKNDKPEPAADEKGKRKKKSRR
jgi:signal peptidase II